MEQENGLQRLTDGTSQAVFVDAGEIQRIHTTAPKALVLDFDTLCRGYTRHDAIVLGMRELLNRTRNGGVSEHQALLANFRRVCKRAEEQDACIQNLKKQLAELRGAEPERNGEQDGEDDEEDDEDDN